MIVRIPGQMRPAGGSDVQNVCNITKQTLRAVMGNSKMPNPGAQTNFAG